KLGLTHADRLWSRCRRDLRSAGGIMKPLRALAVAGASAVLLMCEAVAALAGAPPLPAAMMAPALSATAKYHSLTVAEKAGYSILAHTAGTTCIAEPKMGAMGGHYVRGD